MGYADDEWVETAMTDDSMVAELLMRLKQSDPPEKAPVLAVVPLDWGVRQPRSKQMVRCNIVQTKKEGDLIRASPTTPLSWSGGTSLSGGAGGEGGGGGNCYEESSRSKQSSGRRSKVSSASETTSRKSRKKKTFTELKEEEMLLLKERVHLKEELVTLQIAFEELMARNKSLKRMKLDVQSQSTKETNLIDASKEATCDQSCHTEVDNTPTILLQSSACDVLDVAVCPSSPRPDSCDLQNKDIVTLDTFFVLPDLNLPVEEYSGSEILYGMS